MRNFIKSHWFGLCIVIIITLFLVEFFVILYAPHEDDEEGGFSLCTNKMIENVQNCNQQTWCIFKAVCNNYICYNFIIYEGFKNWITKKSPTPWSDYLYKPQEPELQPELLEFYQQNPDIKEQMKNLMEKNIKLENIKNEEN